MKVHDTHVRTAELGTWLTGVVARNVHAALNHLAREETMCDGWATRNDGVGRSNNDTSTTEAAAMARYLIRLQAEDLRHAIAAVELAAHNLQTIALESQGMRAPAAAQVTRCGDSHHGREGAIEWGDQLCQEIPVKAGLCSAHYQRERRYRMAHHLPDRETEPAA